MTCEAGAMHSCQPTTMPSGLFCLRSGFAFVCWVWLVGFWFWLFGCLIVWLFGGLAVWQFGCLLVWLFVCKAAECFCGESSLVAGASKHPVRMATYRLIIAKMLCLKLAIEGSFLEACLPNQGFDQWPCRCF